jgi:ribonuclease Z
VLFTHGHLDHILGLGGLISTFSRWEAVGSLEIYGGRRTLDRVRDLIYGVVLRGAVPPVGIDLIDVKAGLLLEGDEFEVRAFDVRHRGPGCLGYRFSEKPRRPFLPDKAQALGVPPGPVRRELVNGQSVMLPDGRRIHPDDVLGPERSGLSIAVTGDVGEVRDLVAAVQGVDLLVCEATYLSRDKDMARQFGHITAEQGAWLAREANVRMLVFNHLSQRYRLSEILGEAQSLFANTLIARDFDRFSVTREKITLTNHQLSEDTELYEA